MQSELKGSYKSFLTFMLLHFKNKIVLMLGLDILIACSTLLIPVMSGYIFRQTTLSDLLSEWVIWSVFSLFLIGGLILFSFHGVLSRILNIQVLSKVLSEVWYRVLSVPLKHSQRFISGEMAQKILDYEIAVVSFVSTHLMLLFETVMLVFLWSYLIYCSPMFSAIYGVICLVTISIKFIFFPRSLQYAALQLQQKSNRSVLLNEALLQMNKCRASHIETIIHQRWFQAFFQEKCYEKKSVQVEILFLILEALPLFLIAVFIYVWIYLHTARIPIETILSFMICIGYCSASFEKLSASIYEVIASILPAFQRLQSLFQISLEKDLTHTPFKIQGRFALSRVSWSIPKNGKVILKDVSLEIQLGQFVAFIGESGVGKTSLLKLFLGLECPSSGCVLIDGVNTQYLNMPSIRRQFGVVLQNSSLFAGTIFSNIAAHAGITLEEAWKLARCVGLEEEIQAMPMQMETYLSDNAGESISGGQKQKILLARSLASGPKVLFLDEATSALDNRSQRLIHQNLNALNITRLVIAHRYSAIQEADVIYQVKDGKVHLVRSWCDEGELV